MSVADDSRALYQALVDSHAAELYRFARRMAGNTETAEDLVQETFTEAWRSIGSLRDPEAGRAWLYGILRHRFSRWLRSRKPVPDHQTAPQEPGVVSQLAGRELLEQVVEQLDAPYRETFLLVTIEGFSCAEAAQLLGVPRGTVLSRLHRSRERLRSYLERRGGRLDRATA